MNGREKERAVTVTWYETRVDVLYLGDEESVVTWVDSFLSLDNYKSSGLVNTLTCYRAVLVRDRDSTKVLWPCGVNNHHHIRETMLAGKHVFLKTMTFRDSEFVSDTGPSDSDGSTDYT